MGYRTGHIRYVIALLIASVAFSAGCGERVGERSTTRYRFGYQPFASNLPFFVAISNGYFDSAGVNIEPVRIVSANDAANAVLSRDIVGNATVPLNVVLNINSRAPNSLRIFMVKTLTDEQWSDYLIVRKGSSISSISSLAGRPVGGYPGSAQQALLEVILNQFISRDSIVTQELAPGVQLQALATGQVAALLTYDERAVVALEEDIGQVLVSNPVGRHVVSPMYGFPYVLGDWYVSQKPTHAKAIRDAMYLGAEFIRQHPDSARTIMAEWTNVQDEIAKQVRFWAQVKAEDIELSALQRLADIYYEKKVVADRVDVETLLYTPDK